MPWPRSGVLIVGLLLILGACSHKPKKDHIEARNNGVVLDIELPGWEFVETNAANRTFLYHQGKQQLYLSVSRYKRTDAVSPDENAVRDALLDICETKTCVPRQMKSGIWVSTYATGTTQVPVKNWDAAKLTPKGEMLVSVLRLVYASKESAAQIDAAVEKSLILERD